jgi:hypothetical protein
MGIVFVIALPEIDPAFTDKQIVLAFLKNGKQPDAREGPYRIVISDEKRMVRWVETGHHSEDCGLAMTISLSES